MESKLGVGFESLMLLHSFYEDGPLSILVFHNLKEGVIPSQMVHSMSFLGLFVDEITWRISFFMNKTGTKGF